MPGSFERNSGGLAFREATDADLSDVVRVHKSAYSASHFTTLLPDDVLADYYRRFISDGSSITVAVSRESGRIEGFAVYGEHIPRKIAQFKRAHTLDLLSTGLRHPVTAVRKVLARLGSGRSAAVRGQAAPAEFLLLSIAVSMPRRGTGLRLLELVKSAACEADHDLLGLYVNTDNIAAINAYFRSGFTLRSATRTQYYMEALSR